MKNINNIDNIFEGKLGNYESKIPSGLFDKIEAKRGWKPKAIYHLRSKAWIAILLLSLGIWGLTHTNTSDSAIHAPQLPPIKTEPTFAETSPNIEATSVETTEKKSTSTAIKQKYQAKQVTDSKRNISEKTNTITKKTNSTILSTSPIVNSSKTPRINTIATPLSKNNYSSTKNNTIPKTPSTESKQKATSFNFLKHNISTINPELAIKLPCTFGPEGCYDFGKNKSIEWRFSADAMVSPDMILKTLSPRNNDSTPSYQSSREATEELWYAYSAGIRLSAQMSNGIALRAGLNYSQINESFKYQNESETQIIITEVTDNDGNIIRRDTVRQTGVRFIEHYNRFQQIDIPVMLGYDLEMGRWSVGLNAGAHFNILFTPKGRFLASNGMPTYFSPERPDAQTVFKDNLGISLYGSIAINYHINDRIDFFVEPHFKYQLDPITVAGYELDQNFNTAGVFTGMRFYFD